MYRLIEKNEAFLLNDLYLYLGLINYNKMKLMLLLHIIHEHIESAMILAVYFEKE